MRAATYGGEDEESLHFDGSGQDIDIGQGLSGRVALERRPIIVQDTLVEEDVEDILEFESTHPVGGGSAVDRPSDRLVGVVWVGLYVPLPVCALTAVARLQALANRTIAFMEAARVADDQDELLDRRAGPLPAAAGGDPDDSRSRDGGTTAARHHRGLQCRCPADVRDAARSLGRVPASRPAFVRDGWRQRPGQPHAASHGRRDDRDRRAWN